VTEPEGAILYADADREARLVLPRFLQRVAAVRVVDTIAGAHAAVAEAVPHLVVLDPNLPDGDATALIGEVRAAHPWVQIFVIPRPSWADRTSRFIAAGADDVAVKPFDVGRLPARAGALIRAADAARRELGYRRELESRLSHVERIATLGTMCATVAHEIATPVSLVSANVDVLADALRSGRPLEEERAALQQATDEIRVAAGLIQTFARRIRTFARRDERRRVVGPLAPIVETALLMLKPRLAGRAITVRPPEGEPPVVAHYPIRLTQALLNLLTNAVESIGTSGSVVMRWVHEPDEAGIAVDDDGPGMSEEVRARVFEPFFTSKAEGTGLGLTLVRAIAREHDGRFELLPRAPGPGVTAKLTLPRLVEERPTIP
jgi:signal transduction histidine kinase